MNAIIRKAVYPVAGLGTRFLPATKANPKEMLPIVDKPLIQYAVEEAAACGITEHIFITNFTKYSIENHFDRNFELEKKLEETGKNDLLAAVRDVLPEGSCCVYTRQAVPLGLGHAVLCAREMVGHEPFALFLADDLIDGSKKSCMQQMVEVYEKTQKSVLALQKVTPPETEKYGIVGLKKKDLELGEFGEITTIVEKPKQQNAPSTYASVGRYILNPRVFYHLANIGAGAIGEIQLTDGILKLLAEESVYGYLFNGERFDCGSKLGYLQATVSYARKHPEVGVRFEKYLRECVRDI